MSNHLDVNQYQTIDDYLEAQRQAFEADLMDYGYQESYYYGVRESLAIDHDMPVDMILRPEH